MDLLWLLAKRHYEKLPQPSEVYTKKHVTDTRTAEQIVDDIINDM